MDVDVSGDFLVSFRPQAHDALGISVESSKGWLAQLGLRDGDVIVSIGGAPLGGRDLYSQFAAAIRKPGAILGVLRDGAVLSLTVPTPLPAGAPDELGGDAYPCRRPR